MPFFNWSSREEQPKDKKAETDGIPKDPNDMQNLKKKEVSNESAESVGGFMSTESHEKGENNCENNPIEASTEPVAGGVASLIAFFNNIQESGTRSPTGVIRQHFWILGTRSDDYCWRSPDDCEDRKNSAISTSARPKSVSQKTLKIRFHRFVL